MAITLTTDRQIKNELGIENGMTANYYRIVEFHHYPLQKQSICTLFGYVNKDQFDNNDKSYCEKITLNFNATESINEPISFTECENQIITMDGWEGNIT